MFTICGLSVAVSVIIRVALRGPVIVGLNVTLIVQFNPAASVPGLVGQLLLWLKSPGLEPPKAMLEMVKDAGPLLVRPTTEVLEVGVVTETFPNAKTEGTRRTCGCSITETLLSVML